MIDLPRFRDRYPMKLTFIVPLLFSLLLRQPVFAALVTGSTNAPATLHEVAEQLPSGATLLIGEQHDLKAHQDFQWEVLQAIRKAKPDHRIYVGMEMLAYPLQEALFQWQTNQIDDKTFREKVRWSEEEFQRYQKIIATPIRTGGLALAINLPRSISGKIARKGLDSLSSKELQLLPPDFRIGNDLYYERFSMAMQGHVPPEAIARYFTAHSSWDDTMAWQTLQWKEKIAETLDDKYIFVIIVGDFHVAYGGGTPDRLQQRGDRIVQTISQFHAGKSRQDEIEEWIRPDQRFGPRADYIHYTQE